MRDLPDLLPRRRYRLWSMTGKVITARLTGRRLPRARAKAPLSRSPCTSGCSPSSFLAFVRPAKRVKGGTASGLATRSTRRLPLATAGEVEIHFERGGAVLEPRLPPRRNAAAALHRRPAQAGCA